MSVFKLIKGANATAVGNVTADTRIAIFVVFPVVAVLGVSAVDVTPSVAAFAFALAVVTDVTHEATIDAIVLTAAVVVQDAAFDHSSLLLLFPPRLTSELCLLLLWLLVLLPSRCQCCHNNCHRYHQVHSCL